MAAAQTGVHNPKRSSYGKWITVVKENHSIFLAGHAMVVDPWGAVIGQCSERVGMCFAEIDIDYLEARREDSLI